MSKSLIDEYLEEYNKYSEEYGDKTIIFMMAGKFYEVYATDKEGPDIDFISKKTNYVKTRRNKKIDKISRKNPFLLGFPQTVLDDVIKTLLKSSYTIIVIDQITPPPKPKRGVTGIYSPGTYIDELTLDTNNISSIFIQEIKGLYCIGISFLDLSTGLSSIYEAISSKEDPNYALDEIYRYILSRSPKEIIITKDENIDIEKILVYLEITNKKVHIKNIDKRQLKISYQEEFFSKVYVNFFNGIRTTIENLDMEMIFHGRASFVILLNFVHNHNEVFIENLKVPEILENNKYLTLGNNAIHQLNILDSGSLETGNCKYTSLLDVINNTTTALGYRYLKNAITNPLTNVEDIQNRYDATEDFLNETISLKETEKLLKDILDIEKLSRKFILHRIQPFELFNLIKSFENVSKLKNIVSKSTNISKFLPNQEDFERLEIFIKEMTNIFNLEELEKQNLKNITDSFFNKGIFPEIDKLHIKVVKIGVLMENIKDVLSKYIDQNKEVIQLKRNNRDGYYLTLTKKRADILKNKLSNSKFLMSIDETLSIETKDLEFKELVKGNTKIFYTGLGETSGDILILKDRLFKLVKNTYLDTLKKYTEIYSNLFQKMSNFIGVLDFIKSNAKTAKLYKYSKPIINNLNSKGFLKVKKLRHPIAERLRTDIEYVTHDINIGIKDLTGIMLFGLNSAGKSTLQKAIGICIIMAQSGLYVPAEKLVYSPYNSLFARITGNDNIFKGLSQYTLELTELDAILKRNGPKTLVIGDEICRGTEHKSGNIIVASTIIMLAKFKCSFIFATHLHEIVDLPSIKKLQNVKSFHLTAVKDPCSDNIIFDRILKPGSGSDMYGLIVAKHIIKNDRFIKITSKIKTELLGEDPNVISYKRSKYNSNLYVNNCQICGKKNKETEFLDVHHINFQSNCTKDGFVIGKDHMKMNEKSNLVVLCKKHHNMVHRGELIINGYKDTAKGRVLDKIEVLFIN